MKMTEKTKRNLAIGGGAVICIALIAAIGLQFGKAPAGEDVLPVDTPPASEVVVDPGEAATGKKEEKELVIETGSKETEPETGSTKPAEPEETVKTDPTQKPDGTKVETPPAPVEHEAVVAPSEPEPPADEPQAGDTQNGQIYIPGFGWTENHGGGGSGTTADDMYENGNKIGIMD